MKRGTIGKLSGSVSRTGLRLFRDGEQGMTLIETLVALGIIAAVAVVFLIGMTTSSKAVMVSQESVAAESLAKSQMEDTKAQTYVGGAATYPKITVSQDLASQGYDIVIAAAPAPGYATNDGIQKITVTITRNGDLALTVVDYKVNR